MTCPIARRLIKSASQYRAYQHQVGSGLTPAVLSHHRAYGSVHGGSGYAATRLEDFHLRVTSEATIAKLVALTRNAPYCVTRQPRLGYMTAWLRIQAASRDVESVPQRIVHEKPHDNPQQCLSNGARLFLGDSVTRTFDVDRLDIFSDMEHLFANHQPETAGTAHPALVTFCEADRISLISGLRNLDHGLKHQ